MAVSDTQALDFCEEQFLENRSGHKPALGSKHKMELPKIKKEIKNPNRTSLYLVYIYLYIY